jgi:hypothetical protein
MPNNAARYIRNTPFQYSQTNFELGGEYRVANKQSITARLEREETNYDYRERDKVWENMGRLGYVNRAFSFGTLRASAEYGQRRGDTYVTDVYDQFFSSSLGPYPTANGVAVTGWGHSGVNTDMRKYDLADRDRLALDLRLDLIAMHDLDVGITGQYRDNKYPDSSIGRTDHQTVSTGSLDVNWQPSPKYGITAWYTYQQSTLNQALISNITGAGCTIGNYYYFYSDGIVNTGTAAVAPVRAGTTVLNTVRVLGNSWASQCFDGGPISPLWPDSRLFTTDTQETNNTFGVKGRYDFGLARLELDGTYVSGNSSLNYNYDAVAQNNPAMLALPAAQRAYIWGLAGTGMPDTKYTQEILNFNVVFPISKSFALRLLYRYEQGNISGWEYAGVASNPVPTFNTTNAAGVQTGVSDAIYLDRGPQDYHVNTVGLLVNVTF